MRVRTQLSLAFLLLAVAPLVGIVLYSYLSSQRAFRRAVETEGQVLAEETGKRLGTTRADARLRWCSTVTSMVTWVPVSEWGVWRWASAMYFFRIGDQHPLVAYPTCRPPS